MPSKRKPHVVDESWLEEARCSNTEVTQILPKSRAAHRAVIVDDIVYILMEFVELLPEDERQRTLWSCALVSKSWCDAALHRLYRSPELMTSNIDSFARTVCSGRKNSRTSAHIARLKRSVRHLKIKEADQKALKSTIGRVLDRVNSSLESYESSAVTVNTSVLSSLSRCTNLRSLNLTANQHELNFLDILNATATLPRLETLKLPQNCFDYQSYRLQGSQDLRWPPALRNLQLPDFFLWDDRRWAIPDNAGWPKTLRSLTILHCTSFGILTYEPPMRAPHIESFEIGNCEPFRVELSLPNLFALFPNLRTLKIPAEAALAKACVETIGHISTTHLEVLDLQPLPGILYHYPPVDMTPIGCPTSLDQYVIAFPNLRSLTVPDAVVYVHQSVRRKDPDYYHDTVQPSLEALNKVLQDRSGAKERESSGLFVNGTDRPATIDEEIRRCGMVYEVNAASRSVWLVKGIRRWVPQPLLLLDLSRISGRHKRSSRGRREKRAPLPRYD